MKEKHEKKDLEKKQKNTELNHLLMNLDQDLQELDLERSLNLKRKMQAKQESISP